MEVIPFCDNPLPWPVKHTPPQDEDQEDQEEEEEEEKDEQKEATPKPEEGALGGIELQPVGQVELVVQEDPSVEGKDDESEELISNQDDQTSSQPLSISDKAKVYPKLHSLQCGDSVCEFEFTLYEFIYKAPVINVPPPPPSDASSEVESLTGEEEIAPKKDVTDIVTPSSSALSKVENTEANLM